jgi:hypothetical protein
MTSCSRGMKGSKRRKEKRGPEGGAHDRFTRWTQHLHNCGEVCPRRCCICYRTRAQNPLASTVLAWVITQVDGMPTLRTQHLIPRPCASMGETGAGVQFRSHSTHRICDLGYAAWRHPSGAWFQQTSIPEARSQSCTTRAGNRASSSAQKQKKARFDEG